MLAHSNSGEFKEPTTSNEPESGAAGGEKKKFKRHRNELEEEVDTIVDHTREQQALLCFNEATAREQFCDTVVVAGKPPKCKRFYAHRAILALYSSFFRAMFSSGMREVSTREVRLEEFSPASVLAVLHFMYYGELSCTSSNVMEILSLVEQLDFHEARPRIFHFIASKLLTKYTCVPMWEIAKLYNNVFLERSCQSIISAKFPEIVCSLHRRPLQQLKATDFREELGELSRISPATITHLLTDNSIFGCLSEVEILYFVLAWIKCDTATEGGSESIAAATDEHTSVSSSFAERLSVLKHIRWELISPLELRRCLSACQLPLPDGELHAAYERYAMAAAGSDDDFEKIISRTRAPLLLPDQGIQRHTLSENFPEIWWRFDAASVYGRASVAMSTLNVVHMDFTSTNNPAVTTPPWPLYASHRRPISEADTSDVLLRGRMAAVRTVLAVGLGQTAMWTLELGSHFAMGASLKLVFSDMPVYSPHLKLLKCSSSGRDHYDDPFVDITDLRAGETIHVMLERSDNPNMPSTMSVLRRGPEEGSKNVLVTTSKPCWLWVVATATKPIEHPLTIMLKPASKEHVFTMLTDLNDDSDQPAEAYGDYSDSASDVSCSSSD